MPESPVIDVGSQLTSPAGTLGFGARESADETRQAQQSTSNDTPTDVNANAIVAREQALTFTIAGHMFTANADVRAKLQDQFLARIGLK